MSSPRTSRFRAAVILALALFVWSDAALASFVCPHMTGCEDGMPSQADTIADQPAATAMPCCPVKPETSMECGDSAMECCAWHHRDSDVFAILSTSNQSRPKQLLAVLPAATTAAPMPAAHPPVSRCASNDSYVKPVSQKKTDLRI
jgi:hypothetical protein